MTTYKSLIYLVLDELKLFSDDASYTEDHILYLIDKYPESEIEVSAETDTSFISRLDFI